MSVQAIQTTTQNASVSNYMLSLRTVVATLRRAIELRWRAHTIYVELAQLDDRTLADIGYSRRSLKQSARFLAMEQLSPAKP
jgi:uncharacterized protein YjiS (DUF1127 family)